MFFTHFINNLMFMFGIFGNPLPKPRYKRPYKTDAEAIASDWQKVFGDLYKSMGEYGRKQQTAA